MAIGGLVRLVPRPGAEAELLARAIAVATDVRAEPGNVVALVLREAEAPGEVFMLQLFADAEAVAAHRAARHSRENGPLVEALLARPMEVRHFTTVAGGDAR